MNIEEVFRLVDINNSGYVTKTVCPIYVELFIKWRKNKIFVIYMVFLGNKTSGKLAKEALWNRKGKTE